MSDNPFALEKLLAFAESRPPTSWFDFYYSDACAAHAFVVANGGRHNLDNFTYELGGRIFDDTDAPEIRPLMDICYDIGSLTGGSRVLWSDLATRLRAAIAERDAS